MNDKLFVTLDGGRVSDGSVPLNEFMIAMQGVQDAMRLIVEHLGERQRSPGQPPKWVREQSTLRLNATHVGSYVAELTLEHPPDRQGYLEDFGQQAFDALRNWDGSEDSTLPGEVMGRLYEIPHALPDDVSLWIGSDEKPRKVKIKSVGRAPVGNSDTEKALVHGWLKEVNWHKGTAQLHQYGDKFVQLRFDSDLDIEMLKLANGFVDVRGRGRLNVKGEWITVQVKQLNATRAWSDPTSLETLLNNPNPKIFDPEKVVRASEPFDADEFIGIIHEARDTRLEETPN